MGALSAGLAKVREATHGDEEVGRLGPFVGWALPDSLLLCLTASASEEEDEEGDDVEVTGPGPSPGLRVWHGDRKRVLSIVDTQGPAAVQ